jgi:hypothetical protein
MLVLNHEYIETLLKMGISNMILIISVSNEIICFILQELEDKYMMCITY